MEFKIINIDVNSDNDLSLEVSHNNETIVFGISCYIRINFKKGEEYNYYGNYNRMINEVLTKDEIDQLFGFMKTLHEKLKNPSVQATDLMFGCTQLYNILDYWKVYRWTLDNLGLFYIHPETMKEFIDVGDGQKTRAKTFTVDDIQQFIALSLLTKTYIGVWGTYINMFRNDVGDMQKEYSALSLLDYTEFQDIPPVERYHQYVKHIGLEELAKTDTTLRMIAEDELVAINVAGVVVRKFPIIVLEYRGDDEDGHIGADIYRFTNSQLRSHVKTNGLRIHDKEEAIRAKAIDGEQRSRSEQTHVSVALDTGRLVSIQVSIEDPNKVIWQLLDGTPDMGVVTHKLTEAIKRINQRFKADRQLTQLQRHIVGFVIDPVMSSSAIDFLDTNTLMDLLAVTEVYLEEKGHYFMAALVTSIANDEVQSTMNTSIGFDEITKQALTVLYAFNELKPARKSKEPVVVPLIQTTLTQLIETIIYRTYYATCPEELYSKATQVYHADRRIVLPRNIGNLLVDLLSL